MLVDEGLKPTANHVRCRLGAGNKLRAAGALIYKSSLARSASLAMSSAGRWARSVSVQLVGRYGAARRGGADATRDIAAYVNQDSLATGTILARVGRIMTTEFAEPTERLPRQ